MLYFLDDPKTGETIVQLEIADADTTDKGAYQLVAKNTEGETQSQSITLSEAQVTMEAKESVEGGDTATSADAIDGAKKKKKKVVKKKKKKSEEVKEVPKPELSSFLKNLVRI